MHAWLVVPKDAKEAPDSLELELQVLKSHMTRAMRSERWSPEIECF